MSPTDWNDQYERLDANGNVVACILQHDDPFEKNGQVPSAVPLPIRSAQTASGAWALPTW